MIYGYLLEFDRPDDLVAATAKAYQFGFRKMQPYSPFPIDELYDAIPMPKNLVPLICLLGGITGAAFGYGLQYYTSVIAYPMNIGGRPLHSWPSFIPVTFECTILFAALAAVFGMFWLNELPRPYHPIFNAPNFQLATRNRFFLCVEAVDPLAQNARGRDLLKSLGALDLREVAE